MMKECWVRNAGTLAANVVKTEPNCLMKLGWQKSIRQNPEAHELGWSSISNFRSPNHIKGTL